MKLASRHGGEVSVITPAFINILSSAVCSGKRSRRKKPKTMNQLLLERVVYMMEPLKMRHPQQNL